MAAGMARVAVAVAAIITVGVAAAAVITDGRAVAIADGAGKLLTPRPLVANRHE